MRRTFLLLILGFALLGLWSQMRQDRPPLTRHEENIKKLRRDFGMTDAEARTMMDYSQRKLRE